MDLEEIGVRSKVIYFLGLRNLFYSYAKNITNWVQLDQDTAQ
jgi:hypothetical protein